MNGFVRFLCLIFGISVDGGAAQREAWARKRREMGLDDQPAPEPTPDPRAAESAHRPVTSADQRPR